MREKLSYEELEERVRVLEHSSQQRKRFEEINSALFAIANAVNTTSSSDQLFQAIHLALSPIIDTTNFYISLYDKRFDSLHFPYCVDSVDDQYPPVINVSKTASLTAEVIRTAAPLMLDKTAILHRRAESPFPIPACTPSEIWLGVPLKTRDEIIGVMTVQSYLDPQCYDQTDLEVMVAVADQVAIALDRKRKEKELIESEERFRRIVATANEGIVSLGSDWRIVYANEHFARMLEYPLEELPGKAYADLIYQEELDDFLAHKKERSQGVQKNFERTFRTRNGTLLRALVSATAILDHDNRFIGSFGMITDITPLKQTEAKLQETVAQLRQAVEQIKTLHGIIPICSHCKQIRDDQGLWKRLEVYVREHTEAQFSHGICPTCLEKHYPDLADKVAAANKGSKAAGS
jgi:PAS domain S-box-containing protein